MAVQQQSTPTTAKAPAPQTTGVAPQGNEFGSNSELASGVEGGETGTPTLAKASTAQAGAPKPPPLKNATYKAAYERNDKKTDAMKFQPTAKQNGELAFFEKQWKANAGRYQNVAAKAGIPAQLVAAIHYREGSCNFGTYLHNGDPLGKRTVHVPAGILFNDWESAAVHAIGMKSAAKMDLGLNAGSTDSAAIASFSEAYNGFGYANKGRTSPYVYAGTDQYKSGMYVADGQYSATAVDGRPGILACMNKIGFKFDTGMLSNVGTAGGAQAETPVTAPAPSASTSKVSGSPMMKKGSNGANVTALQTALKSLNYNVGTVDGDFGPNTEAAVRAFQQRHGLGIDGVVGPATAASINATLDGKKAAAPPPASLSVSRLLRVGTKGPDVTALQSLLSSKGYDVGAADGDFGPKTDAAVRAFQRANGLEVDGVVGPATVAKLNGATLAPAPKPSTPAPTPPTGGGTTPPPQTAQTGLAAERGALAAKSGELEYLSGVGKYGAGKSWEGAGANQGTLVDKYQVANKDSAASANPWCGMYVGYNYQKAGIRQELIDNLVFWSGYRLHSFFTQGKYLTKKGKAGDWWSGHKNLDLRGAGSKRAEMIKGYKPRAGDVVLYRSDFSHVGMVDSYDAATGKMFVLEGNAGDRVQANAYAPGSESITFIGRFNDSDFGGSADAALVAAKDPSIRFSDGSLGKTT